ncbi:Crp/Fnr family transcriptional regulator [Roseateles sp. BYS180W]|uniref:Crp/Fnr family transcriptional regulator n=1 Tax=Roseateles rivi TaxID=3299028 RepID=A0ABW7FU57_9BURK
MPSPESAADTDAALDPPSSDRLQVARELALRHLSATLGFQDCPEPTLWALVQGGRLRVLDKEEHLIRQGDSFDMLAVVLDGALNFSQMRPDGQRYLVGIQCAGDTVGYVPMVDGSLYPYDTYARSKGTRVWLIPGEVFRQQRLLDPSVGRAIELQLAYRIRLAYAKMNRDAGQSIEVRLAHTLLLNAQRYGQPSEAGVVIGERLSQEDLSDILGASRQRVNFALKKFKELGLVEAHYAHITILDMEALARFAQDNRL